jgi:hypothetical protein
LELQSLVRKKSSTSNSINIDFKERKMGVAATCLEISKISRTED